MPLTVTICSQCISLSLCCYSEMYAAGLPRPLSERFARKRGRGCILVVVLTTGGASPRPYGVLVVVLTTGGASPRPYCVLVVV